MNSYKCISCGIKNLDKNTVGLNKKLLGNETKGFYCISCLSNYLDTTTEDLYEKIEDFKNEGCKLFE